MRISPLNSITPNMDYVLVSALLWVCLDSCNALAVDARAEPRASVHIEGETVWIVCSVKPSVAVTPELRASSDSDADHTRAVNDSSVAAHKAQSQTKLSNKTTHETLLNSKANFMNNVTNLTPSERRRLPSKQGDLEILMGGSPSPDRKGDATKSQAIALQLKPTLVKARRRRARPREKTPNTKMHIKPLIAETLDNSTNDDQNLEITKLTELSKQQQQGKPMNKPVEVSNITQYSTSRTASAVGVRKKTKSLTLSYRSKLLNQTSSQAKKVEHGARPVSPKLVAKNSRWTKLEKTPRLSQPKQTTLIANNQTKANDENPKHKVPGKAIAHSTETQTQKIDQDKTNEKSSLPIKSTQAPAVNVQSRNATSQHDVDPQDASSRLNRDHNKPVKNISNSEKSTESLTTNTNHQNNSRLDVRNPVRSRATQKEKKGNKSQEQRREYAHRPRHTITAQAYTTLKTPLRKTTAKVTLDETDVKDKRAYTPTEEMHVVTEATGNILDLVEQTHKGSRQTTTTTENVLAKVKTAESNQGRLNYAENTTNTRQGKPKPPAHPDRKQPSERVPDKKGSEHRSQLVKSPGHLTPQEPTENRNGPMAVPSETPFTTTSTEHTSPTHGISKKLEIPRPLNPATARPADRSHELVVQWLLAGVDGSEVEIARRDRRGKLKVAEEFRERQRAGGLDLKWDSTQLTLSLSLSPAVRADMGTYRCVAMDGLDDRALNASAEVQLNVLRPDSSIYPHQDTRSTKGPGSIEEAVINEGFPKSFSQELYILTVAVCCLGLISLLLFLSVILHRHRTSKRRSTPAASRSLQDCKCSIGRSHSKVYGCTASDHETCTNSAKVIKTLQEKFAENRVSMTSSGVFTPPESSLAHSTDLPPEPQLITAEELVPCDVTYAALDLTRPVSAKPQPLPRTIYAQIAFSQSKNG